MFTPAQFRQDDWPSIRSLISANPFALLMTPCQSGIELTHLPMLLEEEAGVPVLYGHVARANPHAAAIADGLRSVAVFTGANGYISPDWYESAGKVPTWNYEVAHVHGMPEPMDREGARSVVAELSAMHEAGRAVPWTLDKLADRQLEQLLTAITAFRMPVTGIEAKSKLGQHMSEADRVGAANGLEAEGGNSLLAARMRFTIEGK